MGFRDELKAQSKTVVDGYIKLDFPNKGDVCNKEINQAVEDTVNAIKEAFRKKVSQGRKNVENRLFGYCYAVKMNIWIHMGYDNSREKIPFTIKVSTGSDLCVSVDIDCFAYNQFDIYLNRLDLELKKEFSKIKYEDRNFPQSKQYFVNVSGMSKYIKSKLKWKWKENVNNWKNDLPNKFSVGEGVRGIIIEMRCDNVGRIL